MRTGCEASHWLCGFHTGCVVRCLICRFESFGFEVASCKLKLQVQVAVNHTATWQASRPRQIASARNACVKGERILKTVSEVISGCLPMNARSKLQSLLAGKRFLKIYVESSRAIARSAKARDCNIST